MEAEIAILQLKYKKIQFGLLERANELIQGGAPSDNEIKHIKS